MKFKRGQKVSPVIEPKIVMLVDTIQLGSGERYHCYWFVNGKVEDSWFNDFEIGPARENGNIGFSRQNVKATEQGQKRSNK